MTAKCSRCAAIAVKSEGDVCSDCARRDKIAEKRLLKDLLKIPKKMPRKPPKK